MLRRLTQRGDTIVEVMVVLAILGLSIGISYATANRSLQGMRQSQENAQATALLQSQLESLRYWYPNLTDAQMSAAFCMDTSASTAATVAVPVSNAACTTGTGPTKLSITQNPSNTNEFTLSAAWDDYDGSTATVTLVYRTYK